jgi:endogenous inhibitor of DNA gyrase (YacG/DUF329 family)
VGVRRCPICRTEITEVDSRHHPFCSERCRLLDLAAWTTERYRIPGDPVKPEPTTPDDDAS